jgi:hypothetical protein
MMRLNEFRQSSILMLDLVNALNRVFDMERVGGKSRVYQVADRSGIIFLLNNSMRGLGLIWSKGSTRVQSVGVWETIDFNRAPDFICDLPDGVALDDLIEPLIKFIKNPGEGLNEEAILEAENVVSPADFRKMAVSHFGDKAKALTLDDMKELAKKFNVQIPNSIRHNKGLLVDANHWNLFDDDVAIAAKQAGLALGVGDPNDPNYQTAVELAKVRNINDLASSGRIVLLGRRGDGEVFEIPGIENTIAKIERMLSKELEAGSHVGSSMERQYKELEDKVTLVAGNKSAFVKSLLITGMPSAGKALSLDTMLPTPSGWTTMGEVSAGDELFDENGEICRVTFATPIQLQRTCYRVVFSDGSSVIADADHRWAVSSLASRQRKDHTAKIMTTAEMAPKLRCGSKWNYRVSCAKPIQLAAKDYAISPYVLGVWLGDGTSSAPTVTTGDQDKDELVQLLAGYETVHCTETSRPGVHLIRMSPLLEGDSKVGNDFKNRLRELGVLNNKHIPLQYLRGSFDQRLALLRGLMDTDGTVDTSGRCEFCVSDERLAQGALEVIRSLGIKARMRVGKTARKDRYRICFTTDLPVFSLSRKSERLASGVVKSAHYRSIVSCEVVDSVPVKCITVDSPSHLFLCTENFIPTHNTFRVMETLKKLGLQKGKDFAVIGGKTTVAALYETLLERCDGLAVFDDCDSVVEDKNGRNILKKALDTDPVREVSYNAKRMFNTAVMSPEERQECVMAMSRIVRGIPTPADVYRFDVLRGIPSRMRDVKPYEHYVEILLGHGYDQKEAEEEAHEWVEIKGKLPPLSETDIVEAQEWVKRNLPNTLDYKGRIIFISNMRADEWDSAILTRAFHINMDFSDAEMFDYIETILEHIKTPQLTEDDKKEVLDYLRELWEAGKITRPVNFRLVQQAFDLRLMNGWRALVAGIG